MFERINWLGTGQRRLWGHYRTLRRARMMSASARKADIERLGPQVC